MAVCAKAWGVSCKLQADRFHDKCIFCRFTAVDPVALSAFLLVFGTSLEYTCGTRLHVRRSSSSGRGFDSSSDCLFLPFFCFFVLIYQKKNGKLQ